MQSQLESVRQYLAAHHMNVVDEWLSGCVEYLTEGNSHTLTEIQNLAKEQWLLNDLKDICPGSLPPGLTDKAKVILNGTFVLQINAAVDIGTPAYQQYLKLQKVNMENVEATTKFEDKISNNRFLFLKSKCSLYIIQNICGGRFHSESFLTNTSQYDKCKEDPGDSCSP